MSLANKAKVKSLFVYPLKSCGAVELTEMIIGPRGPYFDRQWMLVDEDNQFLTQRQFPQLARVKVALGSSAISVNIEGTSFEIEKTEKDPEDCKRALTVKVWGSEVKASAESFKINQTFSDFLKKRVKLVQFREFSERPVPSLFPDFETHIRFADSRPLLLTNTQSLQDFNSLLETPIPMNRFRPNVIVEAEGAFVEDKWTHWSVKGATFSQPKLCSRCVMITVDQEKGVSPGPEPLKILSQFRKINGKAMFGVLFIPEKSGVLRVGDELQAELNG